MPRIPSQNANRRWAPSSEPRGRRRTLNRSGESSAGDALAPYRALIDIAEAELAHLASGQPTGAGAAYEAWGQALDALPHRPPAGAEPLLRRALALADQSERLIAGRHAAPPPTDRPRR
jgi:hypothetical protein